MPTARLCIVLVLVLMACESDDRKLPPLEIESARAVIGIDATLGDTLCRGDLAYIDTQIEDVEVRLGVRRETPVAIYLVPSSTIREFCSSDNDACYRHDEDAVYSRWHSIGHELVHATARDLAFPSLFWSEGAAVALSGFTLKDDRITLEPLDLEAESLTTYRSAGHFSRFLVETRGWDAYRQVLRGEALDAVYGQPVAELTAEYERDAPYAYPPFEPCPHPRIPQVDETTWREQLDFSCESPDASEFEGVYYSGSNGAAVARTVELMAGTYDFLLTGADQMFAIACQATELLVETPPPSNGDLYNEVDLATTTPLEGGEVHRLVLTDGTYLVSISSGTYERASAEVSITRVE